MYSSILRRMAFCRFKDTSLKAGYYEFCLPFDERNLFLTFSIEQLNLQSVLSVLTTMK